MMLGLFYVSLQGAITVYVLATILFSQSFLTANGSKGMNVQWDPIIGGHKLQNIGNSPEIQPSIYISVATISSRFDNVFKTVSSLLQGSMVPTQIFVIISKDNHLDDSGISVERVKASHAVRNLSETGLVSIVYTNSNIGYHRKLLPLLSQVYHENCVIVTVDDDVTYEPTFLANMWNTYEKYGRNVVVAYAVRRIAICVEKTYSEYFTLCRYGAVDKSGKPYMTWPLMGPNRKEMLTLPLGTGGVLYTPKLLHPSVIFDWALINATFAADDILFRFATMATHTYVVTVGGFKTPVETKTTKIFTARNYTVIKPPRRRLRGHIRDNDKSMQDVSFYLAQRGIFDFQNTIKKYIMVDRATCLTSSQQLLLQKQMKQEYGSSLNLYKALTVVANEMNGTLQNPMFNRCGFYFCD